MIGALNRVEIWDPERIAAWEAEHSQTFADMSEDILPATCTARTCSPPQHTQGFAQRGLAPAPVIWGTFPGSRRPSPHRTHATP